MKISFCENRTLKRNKAIQLISTSDSSTTWSTETPEILKFPFLAFLKNNTRPLKHFLHIPFAYSMCWAQHLHRQLPLNFPFPISSYSSLHARRDKCIGISGGSNPRWSRWRWQAWWKRPSRVWHRTRCSGLFRRRCCFLSSPGIWRWLYRGANPFWWISVGIWLGPGWIWSVASRILLEGKVSKSNFWSSSCNPLRLGELMLCIVVEMLVGRW